MSKFILLFCALIPTIYAKCVVEDAQPLMKRSVYEFSIDLLTRIANENEYHFMASPLSAWTLLTCASLGAANKTLFEIKQVLNLHKVRCFNNKYLKIAREVSLVNETDVFLERSSNMFVDEKKHILNKYKKIISKTQISQIETLSFNNLMDTAETINNFVRLATHDTIDEIVSPGDLEDIVMVMIDALFFKGSWSSPFSETETKQSKFYDDKGNHIGDVNLMSIEDEFNISVLKQINAKVLELPYGQNKRFSMFIFLPLKSNSLSTVIAKLKFINLSSIRNSFAEFGALSTIVQIPRFKLTSNLNNLKDLLIDMGIRAAFDANEASFPKISDELLHISTFIQKTDLEVTETGTTASAASAAGFSERIAPDFFIVNQPFLFMIVDNKIQIPLFTGAYSKPSLF